MKYTLKDLTGQKFNRWTVLKRTVNNQAKSKSIYWECLCDCGNIKIVKGSALKHGTSKSCGCLQKEIVRRLAHSLTFKHGHASGNKISRTYRAWRNMHTRCNNPKSSDYKNYGGRGINICAQWSNFENFLKDMGEVPKGLTLDRKDNNGNYESGNCRWATRQEQGQNSRHCKLTPLKVRIINILLKYSSLTQKNIAKTLGIPATTINAVATKRTWTNII